LQAEIAAHQRALDQLRLDSVILQNMAEGVCLIRVRDGQIIYANPKFERMFGYGPRELEARPATVLNAQDQAKRPEEVAQAISSLLNEMNEARYEVCNKRKDGRTFWCRVTTSTFEHSEHGRLWVAVHEDVSEI